MFSCSAGTRCVLAGTKHNQVRVPQGDHSDEMRLCAGDIFLSLCTSYSKVKLAVKTLGIIHDIPQYNYDLPVVVRQQWGRAPATASRGWQNKSWRGMESVFSIL